MQKFVRGIEQRIETRLLKAKRKKTQLERRIMKRMKSGLPPSRLQQLELHLRTACRHGLKQNPRKTFFYFRGVLRGLFSRS